MIEFVKNLFKDDLSSYESSALIAFGGFVGLVFTVLMIVLFEQ